MLRSQIFLTHYFLRVSVIDPVIDPVLLCDWSSVNTCGVTPPLDSFSVCRKKHVSAILNIRGMTRQAERQEILNIVKDIESSEVGGGGGGLARLSRDRALFSEVPVTSEVHCLNVGLSRIALTASSCFTTLRPRRRKTRTPVQENPDDVL